MRLFFALLPQPEVRAAFAGWAAMGHAAGGGRTVRANNVHLTLEFLGELPDAAAARAVGAGLRAAPFELVLDRIEWWRHNGLIVARPTVLPEALADLRRALVEALRAAGLPGEARAFKPHVTLVRDLRRAPELPDVPPIRWPVRDLALMESVRTERSVSYRAAGRWTLAGRPAMLNP